MRSVPTTGDVNELLAHAEGVLSETEDMEKEDEQGGERGNNPETQNVGSLAPAERFVGGTDRPTNPEVKVIVAPALPEDDDMDKVDKELRKVALDSMSAKPLASSIGHSANAKKLKLSESDCIKTGEGNFLITPPPTPGQSIVSLPEDSGRDY